MASKIHTPTSVQRIESFILIWLDPSVDETTNDFKNIMMHLRRVTSSIHTFKNEESCIQFINEQMKGKANLVVPDTLGPSFVPRIHNMPQVNAIFVFYNKNLSEEDWSRTWYKTQGFYSDIGLLCQAIKETVKTCERNDISFSLVKTDGNITQDLNRLEPLFMYTQLIKEIVLSINFEQKHIDQYLEYCRNAFADNDMELNNVQDMAASYRSQEAIWWYTKESFLYPMLNRALRLTEINIILKIAFFIKDLHRHLEKLHCEEFKGKAKTRTLTVYRGQTVSEEDMKRIRETKGGLIAFNSFLSTSKQREVSARFALSALERNSSLVGILYVMNINPAHSKTPFASIESVSAIKGEDEVLFSMNAIFRIDEITTVKEHARLNQVNLTLTNEDDKDLQQLAKQIRQENYPMEQPWFRLGFLVKKMGHADEAKEIFQTLLDQTESDRNKSNIYFELAAAHSDNGDHKEALAFFAKSLIIERKQPLPNELSLASTNHNIGEVYYNLGEYSKALDYYKKALEIREKILPLNHANVATSYNNIAVVSERMGDNENFRIYMEKALKIKEQSLVSNHPDIARSYGNIGVQHYNKHDYRKAMEYFLKAMGILEKVLPPDHRDIAMNYNNIAGTYQAMGDYENALQYMEKAHEIRKRSLPPNHADMGMSYNNIGFVYEKMGDYTKARLNYEHAVDIAKKSLPINHSNRLIWSANLKRVNSH